MIYQEIYNAVIDTKGLDTVIYDINHSLVGMDFIIITSATSSMHIQGICQNVKLKLKEKNMLPFSIEGGKGSEWILMDYSYTLLHIMTIDIREKYNLEELYEKNFQAKKISNLEN